MVSNPVGNRVFQTSIAFGVIDTVAVALRMLARRRTNAAFAADDALIVAALLPLYAMVFIDHFSVEAGGMGLPTDVNLELGGPARLSTLLKYMMSAIVTYTLTVTLVKLSLLIMYRRIFFTAAFHRYTLIVGATVMLWFIVALFVNLFQCRPFQAAFHLELLFADQCINLQAYYRGIAVSNLCLDVILLYMPLPMVWGLKLRTRQKIEVSGIFLLGGITCIASAIRIVAIGNLQTDDFTYTVGKAYLWSQIEPALAILCACLMTLRPLLVDLNLHLSNLSTHLTLTKTKTKTSSSTSKTTSTVPLQVIPLTPPTTHRTSLQPKKQNNSTTKPNNSSATSPTPSLPEAIPMKIETKNQKAARAQSLDMGW